MRPSEIDRVNNQDPLLLKQKYSLVKVFDKTDEINEYRFLPGRYYILVDRKFYIFKKIFTVATK